MSFLHIAYDRDTQIFIIGVFAAIMTIWPMCILLLVPHDFFLSKNALIRNAQLHSAQLVKENEKLRLELIDHLAVIDALLTEKLSNK
jgi:hypothetical protein